MPTYLYQIIDDNGHAGETFEVVQTMHDKPLTKHPQTGQPVRKVFCPPRIAYKHTPGEEKRLTDNKTIEKAGFTKYEKDKVSGHYHRVAGKQGPSVIKR